MIGAILGDIVGSRFEFRNHLSKEFAFLTADCEFTDDTVMTCAVAQALMDSREDFSDLSEKAVAAMQRIGRQFPNCGYGARFIQWMFSEDPQPYNSCGNGSAMRVSPVGFAARDVEEAKRLSAAVTRISHDHPEGMKGAEAAAVAIVMARQGRSKEEIRAAMEEYYDLSVSVEEYRRSWQGHGREICQVSLPQALACFLEGESYEDVIRNCISIGGDSDTIAAIAGGIAEAFYGVPEELERKLDRYLPSRLMDICRSFSAWAKARNEAQKDGESANSLPFDRSFLEQLLNEIFPGLTMFVRDLDLPPALEERYKPGRILREKGFTDASCRVMGMVTTHRFAILSNHMADLGAYEHGTNWGLFVANRSAHFKVLDVYEYQGRTQILLLHLPDDDRWRIFEDVTFSIEEQLIETSRQRFEKKAFLPPVPELAKEDWLARCAAPLGMDNEGNLFDLEP